MVEGKVEHCDLIIRGFRFLGGGGDDTARFDPADVVADRDGEIVYEPGMVKCFDGVEKGFRDIVETNDGSFNCFPKTYIFKDFYPVVKDSRVGRPDDVVGDRQRNGYGVAVDRIAQMTDAETRVDEYAKVASAMAMVGWPSYIKATADVIFFEIINAEDDSIKQLKMIRSACQIVGEGVHIEGASAPILERMIDASRRIEDPNEKAIAQSVVLAKMKEEGCDLSGRENVAIEAIDNVIGMDNRKTFLAGVEVARNIGNAGFIDHSTDLYNFMITGLRKVDDSEYVASVLKEIFPNLRATGLGDSKHPLIDGAISLIAKIEGDRELADAICSAAHSIVPSTQDPYSEAHFDYLREMANAIKDPALKRQAMSGIEGMENYVYEW